MARDGPAAAFADEGNDRIEAILTARHLSDTNSAVVVAGRI